MRPPTIPLRARRGAALACALALGGAAAATAQTVSFVFVAPTATIDANFGAAAFTNADMPDGYKAVRIVAATLARFRAQATPTPRILHIYDQLQTGTTLRNRVNQVLQVSGGKVDVTYYLVDDRTGLPGADGGFSTFVPDNPDGTPGTVTHVWPAAHVDPRTGTDRYDGFVGLGEVGGELLATTRPGGVLAWEGTALHETSHTQFVGEWTKWGAINQRAITYGADGDHYNEEIIGDQEGAFDEGSGNFYGFLHNPGERQELYDWFERTDYRYFVEAQSVMAGVRELYQVQARRQGSVNGVTVFEYRWTDVPGFYILFSESTPTAFHLLFWEHANNNHDQAFSMVVASAHTMWQNRRKRYLCYAATQLALQLEDFAATAAGQAARTAGTLTSSMYPFALLDILTHYGMSTADYQADCRRSLSQGERVPRAFTEYWNHRDQARAAARAHLEPAALDIEQAATAAHTYFQAANTILTPAAP